MPASVHYPLISEINSTVYVGRFGSTITDEDLRATFEAYGDVDAARVVYQPSLNDAPKISRGYGFVRFAREDDAQKAAIFNIIKDLRRQLDEIDKLKAEQRTEIEL